MRADLSVFMPACNAYTKTYVHLCSIYVRDSASVKHAGAHRLAVAGANFNDNVPSNAPAPRARKTRWRLHGAA